MLSDATWHLNKEILFKTREQWLCANVHNIHCLIYILYYPGEAGFTELWNIPLKSHL